MKLTDGDILVHVGRSDGIGVIKIDTEYTQKPMLLKEAEELRQRILKNQDNIPPDKAFDYVMENMYDEIKEAVFEQEADNRHE